MKPGEDSSVEKEILLRSLPHRPGVYIMKDREDRVLYVGKARDLVKRVRSYFTGKQDIKTRHLVRHIVSIEHIVTKNEYEALVLENNLIKKWSPRYNINLKDGKSYPVIRITREEFPRMFRTRRIVRDGSDYFGPYANVRQLDVYLRAIDKLYPLRKCKGKLRRREHPCLYYHIGACPAPCCGKISGDEYRERVKTIKGLLSKGAEGLVKEYRDRMNEASKALDFEAAATYRDILRSIEEVSRPQEVQDFDEEMRDYIACAGEEGFFTFLVFQMRGGKLTDREIYHSETPATPEEALFDFVYQYYRTREQMPSRIFLEIPLDRDLLDEYIRREHKSKVAIAVPQRGKHASILRMTQENARLELESWKQARNKQEALRELQTLLELPSLPRHIEGFDIAHLGGTNTVASMVSFRNGRPDKKAYRRYKVKSLHGAIDDFESLREITARRYTRVMNENQDIPDLILIDGGKGQVSAVAEILQALDLSEVPLVGLAKKQEELFLKNRSDPILLPEGSEALRVLQAVRDEAHRFATSFQKRLREKDTRRSVYETIPGIGRVRAAKLLQAFGSPDALRDITAEEAAERTGLPLEVAERVVAYFSGKNLTSAEE